MENTTDQFDPTAALEAHWYDTQKSDLIIQMREEQGRTQLAKNFEEAEGSVAKGLEDQDAMMTT